FSLSACRAGDGGGSLAGCLLRRLAMPHATKVEIPRATTAFGSRANISDCGWPRNSHAYGSGNPLCGLRSPIQSKFAPTKAARRTTNQQLKTSRDIRNRFVHVYGGYTGSSFYRSDPSVLSHARTQARGRRSLP